MTEHTPSPMDAPEGAKFGMLILPTAGDNGAELNVLGGRSWCGRVGGMLDADDVRHWKEWLGSLRWEEIVDHGRRIVLLHVASARPEVNDDENVELQETLAVGWEALLLTRQLFPFAGESWIITGQLDGERLASVRSAHPLGPVVQPFYTTRKNHTEKLPWREPDPWLEHWRELCEHMHANAASWPAIIRVAVYSFVEALQNETIEFKIPNCVRAAEAIVAVPRGQGKRMFAERVLRIAPSLASHWFVGVSDLDERLRELHQHRSDCVHGKVPFDQLVAAGDAGADRAAWFEYLAEIVARETILFAIHSPALLAAAASRPSLEAAWANGDVP